jgi:hypothetical protein
MFHFSESLSPWQQPSGRGVASLWGLVTCAHWPLAISCGGILVRVPRLLFERGIFSRLGSSSPRFCILLNTFFTGAVTCVFILQ